MHVNWQLCCYVLAKCLFHELRADASLSASTVDCQLTMEMQTNSQTSSLTQKLFFCLFVCLLALIGIRLLYTRLDYQKAAFTKWQCAKSWQMGHHKTAKCIWKMTIIWSPHKKGNQASFSLEVFKYTPFGSIYGLNLSWLALKILKEFNLIWIYICHKLNDIKFDYLWLSVYLGFLNISSYILNICLSLRLISCILTK